MNEQCDDNRFQLIEACKKDFLENTNISEEEKIVLDTMLFRMWQLGLLKKYEVIDEDYLKQKAYTNTYNLAINEGWHAKDGIYKTTFSDVCTKAYIMGFKDACNKKLCNKS